MKKFSVVLLGAAVAVSLAACGNDQEAAKAPANTTAPAGTEASTTAPTAVPTADELLTKASEAAAKVKSYAADAVIKQDITVSVDGKEQKMQNENSTTMEVVQEPMSAHMNISTKVVQGGQNQEQKQELYITNDAVYLNANDTWQKAPDSAKQQFVDLIKQQGTLKDTIDRMKSMASDTKVTDEGDHYNLVATLTGDKVKEQAQKFLSGDAANAQMAEMMKQMNIHDMEVTYMMDKTTSNLTGAAVKMTMDMDQQGQKMNLVMDMDSTYSKYNEFDKIEVPADVVKSAK
ncbi:DUF6612 family protein [Paenibacillus bovis]|uniref:Lipoprotein n=1 Tax=Paenibacillus bovis TaxID=1616788 RepID=A0A172ZJJ7_9BACL|nr:DUF6612 family protein [Paenibacillus bovis]ANF97572.1 hypothetical protein AR543_17195 [Paenibacillus bovis]